MIELLSTSSQRLLALLMVGMLAGCVAYSPSGLQNGASQAQIVEKMGAPTATYPPPPGAAPEVARRLEYARGPYGKHTYMLDLDGQGRLLSWQQVLTEERFFRVTPGMTELELKSWLGTPSQVRQVGWLGEMVWSYRYESSFCVWFEVSLKKAVVIGAGQGPDPACEPRGNEVPSL